MDWLAMKVICKCNNQIIHFWLSLFLWLGFNIVINSYIYQLFILDYSSYVIDVIGVSWNSLIAQRLCTI